MTQDTRREKFLRLKCSRPTLQEKKSFSNKVDWVRESF